MEPIISIKEARHLLGRDADSMSDGEIAEMIGKLEFLNKFAFKKAIEDMQMKKDAQGLAELIYDIYEEDKLKRNSEN